MATTQKTNAPVDAKAKKEKKPAIPAATRIRDQLKRAAVTSKITTEELDKVAELATALKAFVS